MNPPVSDFYDPANAARLCQASAQAYAAAPAGADRVVECPARQIRVVLFDDGPDLVLAFRGTAHLRNWLTDLDCQFVPSSYGRVHAGFAAALSAVFAQLAELIFDAHYAGKKIWLTGHSLGGALALLAARQLIKPMAGCYTFGQPRVGDADFCQSYDALLKSRTHRVVHDADIVPRVPWLLGSYRHAGHEAFYPSPKITNDRFPITHWKLDPSFWSRLPGDACALFRSVVHGRLALLDDHHVNTYLALFNARPQTQTQPEPESAFSI